jgi:asparagine synthase (glutamine-hydrolysing)
LGPVVSKGRRDQLLRPHLDFTFTVPDWIRPDWAAKIGLADRWRSDKPVVMLPTFAQQQRYGVYAFARRHVNWDNVLAYAAMQGIEIRHPLHDLRLTRFFMGAAGGILIRGGQRKHLLREAMRGTLPEVVRTRRDKANFSAPIIDGVSAHLEQRALMDSPCVQLGWVDAGRLAEFHAAHAKWVHAGATGPVPRLPYAPVWSAIAMNTWLEHAVRL